MAKGVGGSMHHCSAALAQIDDADRLAISCSAVLWTTILATRETFPKQGSWLVSFSVFARMARDLLALRSE